MKQSVVAEGNGGWLLKPLTLAVSLVLAIPGLGYSAEKVETGDKAQAAGCVQTDVVSKRSYQASADVTRALQSLLVESGHYLGPIDGKFGKKTRDALDKYLSEKVDVMSTTQAKDCAIEPVVTKSTAWFEIWSAMASQATGDNLLFAPLSLNKTLQLLQTISAGETEKLLNTYLGSNNAAAAANSAEDQALVITERLLVASDLTLNPAYAVNSPVSLFDFKAENARGELNTSIAEETKGRISDLLGPDVPLADSRIMALSALHFKRSWDERFDAELTKSEPFHTTANESVDVDMMSSPNLALAYYKDADFEAVVLPFNGLQYHYIIVKGSQWQSARQLVALMKKSGASQLLSTVVASPKQAIALKLPRHKLTASVELTPLIRSAGMAPLIDTPDFSKLTSEDVTLSKVLQKVFLEVNEVGAEAAAATVAIASPRSFMTMEGEMIDFVVDQPFLAFLVKKGEERLPIVGAAIQNPNAQ